MAKIVRREKRNIAIRQRALDLTRYVRQKNWLGEIHALFNFVQNEIRYVRDVRGVETVAAPTYTMSVGQGDCDDKCVLLASLLESIGHPARFVAVGFEPDSYSHVMVQSRHGPKWVWLETTEQVKMDWKPPGIKAVMVEHI